MKAGTIGFDDGALTCIVRDVSISGAVLDVTSSAGIPDHFTLSFRADDDGQHVRCCVAWRRENQIGVPSTSECGSNTHSGNQHGRWPLLP